MKKTRTIGIAVLIVANGMALLTPHRHAGSAFIYAYVLSGEIRSQVNDEPARVYRAGETWFVIHQ